VSSRNGPRRSMMMMVMMMLRHGVVTRDVTPVLIDKGRSMPSALVLAAPCCATNARVLWSVANISEWMYSLNRGYL